MPEKGALSLTWRVGYICAALFFFLVGLIMFAFFYLIIPIFFGFAAWVIALVFVNSAMKGLPISVLHMQDKARKVLRKEK